MTKTIHLMHYRNNRKAAVCGADSGLNRGKKLNLDRHLGRVTCKNCLRGTGDGYKPKY